MRTGLKRTAAATALAVGLMTASCSGSDNTASTSPQADHLYKTSGNGAAYMDAQPEALYEAAPAAPPPPHGGAPVQTDGAVPDSGPMLAYSYARSIETPGNALAAVVESHAAACRQAGPTTCMVVNISQSGLGEDWANANLSLKAAPAWSEAFLGGLSAGLESQKSRITSASEYAEDLSTQIIDTDARLKAKVTLRNRLQALLTDRPSELKDLLALESELARVQADIDSTTSVLAALRQRVAMSNINLSYSARQSPASRSVWRPLSDAFGGFFGHFAGALAAIVTTIAVLLPWIPVVIGLIWLARSLWRRVFRKRNRAAPPPPPNL